MKHRKPKRTSTTHSIRELKAYSRSNKRRRDVIYEQAFREKLMEAGLQYQRQRVIGYYIVDFLLKKRRLIVEVDEAYHNRQTSRDRKRQEYLEMLGFIVMRVKWDESYTSAIERIMALPESRDNSRFCSDILAKINARDYRTYRIG